MRVGTAIFASVFLIMFVLGGHIADMLDRIAAQPVVYVEADR